MMSFPFLFLFLLLILSCFTGAERTLWIDSSCTQDMQKVVKRAIKMADRAETRLQNKGDAAIAAQVKRVFQLDMTSAGDQLDLGFVQSEYRGLEVGTSLINPRRILYHQEYQSGWRRQ